MSLIYLLLRTSPLLLSLVVFAGILSGSSAAGLIALINNLLSQHKSFATIIVWGFIALCLLRLTTSLVAQILLIHLSQKAIRNLRMLLIRRILASPLRHLERIGAHRLLAALTEDIQAISATVIILPFFCINIGILIACHIYLFWMSGTVFLLGFVFLCLGIYSYQLPIMKAMSFLKLAREQEDRLFNHLGAVIQGTKELKLNNRRRQAFLSEELHTTARSYHRYHAVGLSIFAAAANWGQVLFFVAIGLLLFILPSLKNTNSAILSAYAVTIIYMMSPLEFIMSMLPTITKAIVALKKVESLGFSLATNSNEIVSNSLLPLEKSWKGLELVGVTHSYYQEKEESNFTLGPINLMFYPGELAFIVGGNGSGKSTLAKLITGLYTPEAGEIYLDSQEINDHNREWYCQQFSVVFSDFYLFDHFLGLDNSNLDFQTQHYLVQLQLDHKVNVNNGRLSTTSLSQGQRKRLALLATYLEDRPIYMFDEWASDQDPLFKKVFYTQILPELKRRGKTVLVISHDDQYFYLADRIIKLEYGQVSYEKVPVIAE